MTFNDRRADALQAAYFRSELDGHRRQLCDTIAKRRVLIERRSHASHLRAEVHSAEAEVRYLDRLITRLDHRFGDGRRRA